MAIPNSTSTVSRRAFGLEGLAVFSLLTFPARAQDCRMSVGYEGINTDKFPPAAKWTLHIYDSSCCSDFSSHVDDAVAMFPDPVQNAVKSKLNSADVLNTIKAVNKGTGVHVIFEFPIAGQIPVVGPVIADVVKLLNGEVWGPWVYPI
jgi:hypothetical protein